MTRVCIEFTLIKIVIVSDCIVQELNEIRPLILLKSIYCVVPLTSTSQFDHGVGEANGKC